MNRPYAHIRTSVERHVAWIEFYRPPVNAFTRPMVDETYDAIGAALADPDVRILVLASAVEGYFSAGADLHTFKGLTPEGVRDWARRCHELARLLRGSAKPLLAAIHGTAVGGGLEMTLHCDVRFAATDARLGQPEIRIGFIPPIATTQALAHLIGRPRAIRYLYDGGLIAARLAFDWGLIDELVEPQNLRRHVQAYGEELAAKSPAAILSCAARVPIFVKSSKDTGMVWARSMNCCRKPSSELPVSFDVRATFANSR